MIKRVLAFDPGETTGWFCVDYDNSFRNFRDNQYESFCGTVELWNDIPRMIQWRYLPDIIICERFGLYPGKAKALSHSALLPVEVIGVIKWVAQEQNTPVIIQPASLIKRVILTQAEQEICGSSPHIQDACKHALAFILSRKGVDFLK